MPTETLSYFEIASHLPPCATVTFHGVSWEEYEQLLEKLGEETGLRVSYNHGTLNIMTLSSEHEGYARFFDSLMTVIRLRLGLNVRSFGSTTMRQPAWQKGNEPDACFYVQSAPAIGNKMQIDFATDPPPDIAVEVDIHHDSRDKFSIYAALGVPEIWRYDGEQVTIRHLRQDDYVSAETSQALPMLTAGVLTEYLGRMQQEGEFAAILAFDEWLQSLRP